MSCSTTSFLAGARSTNSITIEDPYIFTETVPTTPPILFSNSQKSRNRFESKPQKQYSLTGKATVGESADLRTSQLSANKVGLYVKDPKYGAQACSIAVETEATVSKSSIKQLNVNPPTAVLGVLNTNNIKNNETKATKLLQHQHSQRQQKNAQNTFAAQNENIIEKKQLPKLSTTPPPLLMHTPSLWQTPLLLESAVPSTVMPAAPLPPSNFHHTTIAQHLQKLQCLKKPKKANSPIVVAPPTSTTVTSFESPARDNVVETSLNKQQHSTTDLNEIPINVIFRAVSLSKTSDNTPSQIGAKVFDSVITEHKKPNLKTDPIVAVSSTKQKKQLLTKEGNNECQQKRVKKSNNFKNPTAPATISDATPIIFSNNLSKTSKPKKRTTAKKRQANAHFQNPKVQKRLRRTMFFPSLLKDGERAELVTAPDISLSTKAVAVVKMSQDKFIDNKSLLSDCTELPFCVQKHWHKNNLFSAALSREERLSQYKSTLRRQAMQLLATRSLQRLPFHVARKRLLCVDVLLRKYRDHNKTSCTPNKLCEIELCENDALTMTTFCQQHLAKSAKQSIFVLCSARDVQSNSQPTTCNVSVLNIQKQYAPPLCCHHFSQQQQQQQSSNAGNAKACDLQANKLTALRTNPAKSTILTRKRKYSAAYNCPNDALSEDYNEKMQDMSELVSRRNIQRKNRTTSLESTASNLESSFRNSGKTETAKIPFLNSNMLSPPALAPLSYSPTKQSSQQLSENRNLSLNAGTMDPFAEQEIDKLVAQFAMAAAAKSTPAISNCIFNNNTPSNSFNFINTNSNSNLTSSGVGSSSSLPSTDELLTQDMLSNCENSSAYASSSEDTGLGELSESELIAANSISNNLETNAVAAGNDVGPDEIPLGDARLLEESDLVNVFGTLPVNLNELFNSVVQQDEREEVERALEIADKHLRCLQQTIGSDTDFLDDFLNVNDDMLVDTDDMCSKMEVVSSTLPPNFESAAMDIRGLLQT